MDRIIEYHLVDIILLVVVFYLEVIFRNYLFPIIVLNLNLLLFLLVIK